MAFASASRYALACKIACSSLWQTGERSTVTTIDCRLRQRAGRLVEPELTPSLPQAGPLVPSDPDLPRCVVHACQCSSNDLAPGKTRAETFCCTDLLALTHHIWYHPPRFSFHPYRRWFLR